MRNQTSEIQNQLDEQQIQNSELENQIMNLQNRSSELDAQILELESQNIELESQIDKCTNLVKITEFKMYGGIKPIAGMVHDSYANLTIRNLGINPIENLSLSILYANKTVSYISFHDGTRWIQSGKEIAIEVMHVNEELKFTTYFGFVWPQDGGQFRARISLKDKVLDEISR